MEINAKRIERANKIGQLLSLEEIGNTMAELCSRGWLKFDHPEERQAAHEIIHQWQAYKRRNLSKGGNEA